MDTSISATDAVRHFSELLNNIKYRGDRYTIVRGGKPAAAIVPVEGEPVERSMGELRNIYSMLPRLDQDDVTFADDVLSGVKSQPPLPEASAWE